MSGALPPHVVHLPLLTIKSTLAFVPGTHNASLTSHVASPAHMLPLQRCPTPNPHSLPRILRLALHRLGSLHGTAPRPTPSTPSTRSHAPTLQCYRRKRHAWDRLGLSVATFYMNRYVLLYWRG